MTPGPRRAGHAVFDELAVGYALHALEPEDDLRFTTHLEECDLCRRSVAEHEQTLAQLARMAPDTEPPPAVLEGILAAVSGPPSSAAPSPPPVADELAGRRARRDAVSVQRGWLLGAAAGVTALVIGLGGWAALMQDQRDAEADRGDRLAQAVAELERPATRTVSLQTDSGEVQAVVLADGSAASLVVDGLDPTGTDSVYVLWGQQSDGSVQALTAFDVPQSGLSVLAEHRLAVPVSQLTTLMVTRERGKAMPQQTTQPVVLVGQV